MKKQELTVTIEELRKLEDALLKQGLKFPDEQLLDRKFLISIVNEQGLSDTWEIEK